MRDKNFTPHSYSKKGHQEKSILTDGKGTDCKSAPARGRRNIESSMLV